MMREQARGEADAMKMRENGVRAKIVKFHTSSPKYRVLIPRHFPVKTRRNIWRVCSRRLVF
jgi:hypothetical protein